MRYYLLDQDEEELVIDLQLTKKHSNELFEFELCYTSYINSYIFSLLRSPILNWGLKKF